jgi:hypothetical protein
LHVCARNRDRAYRRALPYMNWTAFSRCNMADDKTNVERRIVAG